MKRFFTLLSLVLCMLTASAQMNIWRGGYYTQYPFEEVDSITFGRILMLSDKSLSLTVGNTYQLTANMPVDKWETSNAEVATVVDGLITAISKGTTIISATAKSITKMCVVNVTEEGPAEVKGSQIWPIIMDAVTYEENASKIKADFRVDDTNNFLYIWANAETYVAGDGAGKNFFGNNEGYVSLIVAAPAGWSGCGFCLGATSAAAAEELRKAIVANPDDYYFHFAMKATTTGNHQFYIFNDNITSFAVGTATIESGAVIGDFTRDGSWAEFDVPMSQFATALASLTFPANGNIFCALSGAQVGSQLNLDAVYFYKK